MNKKPHQSSKASVDSIFSHYTKIIEGISKISVDLGKLTSDVVNLDREISAIDQNSLIQRRLRIKIVFGITMTMRTQLNRLASRMKNCAKEHDRITNEIDQESVFE